MDMRKLALALQDLRNSLPSTDIPEEKHDLIVGAAAGVMLALTHDR
jgi:hypothetical protein